jgi:ribosomal protein L40E
MSDYRDNWRDARKAKQNYRQSLVPCYQCGTKNGPEDETCRNCGAPNENHRKSN